MKSSYKLYPDLKLGIVTFKPGELDIQTVLDINNSYKNHPDFSKINFMVVSLLGAIPNFGADNINQLITEFSSFTQENNHKKRVFVVDGNLLTAFTYIFQDKIPGNSEYCSTIEKAFQIIQCPISFPKFKELIQF